VGDREILKTSLNSSSKNTPETNIFPQGTKSLLTNVICVCYRDHVVAGWPGVKYSDMSGRITEKTVVFCCQNY